MDQKQSKFEISAQEESVEPRADASTHLNGILPSVKQKATNQTKHDPITPNQRAHPGVLLTLLVIVIVLIALLILGIHLINKNLEALAFLSPVLISHIGCI
ncbi:MAG TPA: hypothetical protein PK791_03795 [Anaerolineaceae bacterium]|nr:hypothetical protein [Anaerolineaceae bacterium]HOH92469.1 hypothetical protein [Anaerolineaceae bacterium]